MKNYKKEIYKTKNDWLKARGIGGSDAAAIVNMSKWLSSNDVYNRIVFDKEKIIKENERMKEGAKAEEYIRELWSLDHSSFKTIRPPKRNFWIFRRKDYPLLTCTPDGLFYIGTDLFGLEVKDVELINGVTKQMWESNILPDQYYYQVLHYMVVIEDLKGVCLTAHLKYFTYDETTKKWVFDYAVDKNYWIHREDIIDHIKYLEEKEIDFIENNINKKHRPKTVIKKEF